MTVLLITHSQDNPSIEQVREAILARGQSCLRLDTDRYPTEYRFSSCAGDGVAEGVMETPDGSFPLSEIRAVWWRRTVTAGGLPEALDPQTRSACVEESSRHLAGMVASLDAFTVDPLTAIRRAEHKPLQLKVAQRLGLDVPRTVNTNDPAVVRRLAQQCPQGIVTKMMASFAIYDASGSEQVVFTNPVQESDLADLDGLSLCPMTFQERIEKHLELRVTVVGDRVFAAAIDSQRSERARHDWRRDGVAMIADWTQYSLPPEVSDRLLAYMQHFGLNYGAADFIVTPEGRHVFLEVNPAGEWFWLQDARHRPIAEALADVLTGRAPHRGGFW